MAMSYFGKGKAQASEDPKEGKSKRQVKMEKRAAKGGGQQVKYSR
jgi:hypothetical protein